MKIGYDTPLPAPPTKSEEFVQWAEALTNQLSIQFGRLSQAINQNLGFGTGSDLENIRGKWHTYTTNAVADTEDTIAHELGVVPIGFLVFQQDKAGVLYKGGTAWTSSNLYLKCSVASVTVTLFILTGPPTSD